MGAALGSRAEAWLLPRAGPFRPNPHLGRGQRLKFKYAPPGEDSFDGKQSATSLQQSHTRLLPICLPRSLSDTDPTGTSLPLPPPPHAFGVKTPGRTCKAWAAPPHPPSHSSTPSLKPGPRVDVLHFRWPEGRPAWRMPAPSPRCCSRLSSFPARARTSPRPHAAGTPAPSAAITRCCRGVTLRYCPLPLRPLPRLEASCEQERSCSPG